MTCGSMGGAITSPDTPELNEKLVELMKVMDEKFDFCRKRLWIGLSDREDEGNWVFTSRRPAAQPFSMWQRGEPNGKRYENCAEMIYNGRWNDISCDVSICSTCLLSRVPRINIRGFCPKGKYDYRYTWVKEFVDGQYLFRGFERSKLVWNQASRQWRIADMFNDENYGYINTTDKYPFGRHDWIFPNGSCVGRDLPETRSLLINTCDESQFPCHDGICISQEKRCDKNKDCRDFSDEKKCELVEVDSLYVADYQPPSLTGDKVIVSVAVRILSVLDIVELDMLIKLQFKVFLTWYDPRITFHNLKNDQNMNFLTASEKETIWIPKLVMENTDKKYPTIVDQDTTLLVYRLGESMMNSRIHVNNDALFKGGENTLRYERTYDINFQCAFNLEHFPFDAQKCEIVLKMFGNLGLYVDLKKHFVEYVGSRELVKYLITDVEIAERIANGTSRVVVTVSFQRRFFYSIAVTYVPTTGVIFITYLTNYFPPQYFAQKVMVTLTSMLVMTTMFVSLSSSLPATAYLKIIDYWMLFGLSIQFMIMLLHTSTEYFLNKEKIEKESVVTAFNNLDRIKEVKFKFNHVTVLKKISKNITILTILTFGVCYWSYSLYIYSQHN